MPDIVLATLNAKYIHAAFGLRYLHANLGGLRERACIAEFDIKQRPLEIVERILALEPRIVGLGVYIWNVVPTTEVVALLKRIRPELIIILGGPEVSYETDGQEIVRLADHTITGEADVKFAEVCKKLLESGERKAESGMEESSELSALRSPLSALPKIIPADIPKLDTLALPYELYTDADLAHRVIYVEASRGCPFTCEFCLSSLDIPVRQFPLDAFLAALDRLLARGATQFKFVDRTFNLHLPTSTAILQFFLDRWRDGLFVHFEMIPDRLPEQLRVLIAQFPPGAVQLEVGIQTFDDATSLNISRRQNVAKLEDNFRYLRAHTGVHIHADLIVGLPGEGIESFGRGFDRLLALRPQEIQVGILKRLRGTPIVRHDAEYAMTYSSHPPYEILSTRDIAFPDMQRMRRFARYWDLVGNSGNFTATLPMLWESGVRKAESGKSEASATRGVGEGVEKCGVGEAVHLSTFESFLRFSDWLFRHLTRTHTIALDTLAKSLFTFLTEQLGLEKESVASALSQDWRRTGRKDLPPWLEEHAVSETPRTAVRAKAPRRQARHTLAS